MVDETPRTDGKRWPVRPNQYPLQGRMEGEVHMPPEFYITPEPYVKTLPGYVRALIWVGGAVALWVLFVWFVYSDAPNPWAMLVGY